MLRYVRLLWLHVWSHLIAWVRFKLKRCPFCGAKSEEGEGVMGGGVFRYRRCDYCYAIYDFQNVSPPRAEEDSSGVVIPF